MMKIDEVLAQGFVEHPISHMGPAHELADRAFQKRVLSSEGITLFFVNLYFYEYRHLSGGNYLSEGWKSDVRMYTADYAWFNVSLHDDSLNAEQFLNKLKETFVALKCVPDPHN